MSKMQVVLNFNFKKILYESSYGNYLVFYNSSFIKNKNIFMLPSKKRFSLPFIIFSFFNRKENIFKRKNFYGFYKYVQSKKVRGVAKNPVDHHNGGSSKTKKPFFSKYYKIAKFSK